jgi:F-type H+-transporting ATPase subunit delta
VTSKAAAHRYARALFDVAVKEQQDLDDIAAQLAAFVHLFEEHPTLERVLLNPAVPTPRKHAAVAELAAAQGVTSILAKLFLLLADRDRLVVLPDLLSAYKDRLLAYRGWIEAEVTTAEPLAPGHARQIEERLAAATGRHVTVSTRVDPSIIGGIVTRIGGTVYDSSITRQLEKMRSRLAAGM